MTVGALNAVYQPTVLQPGEKAPWLAFGNQGLEFKEIKVQTEAVLFAGSYGERDYSRAFRTEGLSVVPGSSTRGAPKITGQVVNAGSRTTSWVKVLVAVDGADGSLADVGQGSIKLGAPSGPARARRSTPVSGAACRRLPGTRCSSRAASSLDPARHYPLRARRYCAITAQREAPRRVFVRSSSQGRPTSRRPLRLLRRPESACAAPRLRAPRPAR